MLEKAGTSDVNRRFRWSVIPAAIAIPGPRAGAVLAGRRAELSFTTVARLPAAAFPSTACTYEISTT